MSIRRTAHPKVSLGPISNILDFVRASSLGLPRGNLYLHPSFGLHQRLAKRVHLSVDVIGIEDGLGDFLAQELRVPTPKPMDQRFEGGHPNVERQRCLPVAQADPVSFIPQERPQGAEDLGFAQRGLLLFQAPRSAAPRFSAPARRCSMAMKF